MIDPNFAFKGKCENIAHVCSGVNDTGCVNITALELGKFICTISNNIITLDIKMPIQRNKAIRIQTTVANPGKYIPASTNNGILVFLESRYAKYKHEFYNLTNIFGTL